MTSFPFDTLGASKQLRGAGMPEGMAEAVVSVFQHAAMTPDFSHLATKADLDVVKAEMATKADLDAVKAEMATKADLKAVRAEMATKADLNAVRADMATKADLDAVRAEMATKADIADMATKADLSELRLAAKADLLELEVRIMERMRQQGWALMGGMTVLLAVSTAIGRLIG
ncbi:MAG: hypothetical protein Q7J28_11555 [Caulobacter sp.]|nr:hypothetical protein [Caulobacter sp.]